MKKAGLSIFLCLCMALSLLPSAASAGGMQLSDEAVYALVSGYGFLPAEESAWDSTYLTRAQAAKAVYYLNLSKYATDGFAINETGAEDVEPGDEYAPYIWYCLQNNLRPHNKDVNYSPDVEESQGDFATMLLLSLGYANQYTDDSWGEAVLKDADLAGLYEGLMATGVGQHLSLRDAARMLVNAGQSVCLNSPAVTMFESIRIRIDGGPPAMIFEDKNDDKLFDKGSDVLLYAGAAAPALVLSGSNLFVMEGYLAPQTFTVGVGMSDGSAPPACSYAWYAGELDESAIFNKENPPVLLGSEASFTAPTNLALGRHRYTAYVSTQGSAAIRVFTLEVMEATAQEVTIRDLVRTDPSSNEFTLQVTYADGSSSPVTVEASDSAAQGMVVNYGTVSVELTPAANGSPASTTARWQVTRTTEDITAADAAAIMNAVRTAPTVGNAVDAEMNPGTAEPSQPYSQGATTVSLVREPQQGGGASENEQQLHVDGALIDGVAALGGTITAGVSAANVSLSPAALNTVAGGLNVAVSPIADYTLPAAVQNAVLLGDAWNMAVQTEDGQPLVTATDAQMQFRIQQYTANRSVAAASTAGILHDGIRVPSRNTIAHSPFYADHGQGNIVIPTMTLQALSCINGVWAVVLPSWADDTDTRWYHDADSEFTLTTPQQLAGLAALVNAGTDFTDKTITLGADIDLSGALWTPIGVYDGSRAQPFCGTFDGNGKTVSGMVVSIVNTGNADELCAGLFAYTGEHARIRRLTVAGEAFVTGGSQLRVGGVVGYAEGSLIESCRGEVDVNAVSTGGRSAYAGGVAGCFHGGSLQPCAIAACESSGNVRAESAAGEAYAGGIAGSLSQGHIRDCAHTGKVVACAVPVLSGAMDIDYPSFSGGMAGQGVGESTVRNSFHRGRTGFQTDPAAADSYDAGVADYVSLVGIDADGLTQVVNCYYECDGLYRTYWDEAGAAADGLTEAALKALTDTLNAWVAASRADPGLVYSPWYSSTVYNDGYPCFTQYLSPVHVYALADDTVPVLIDGTSYRIGTARTVDGVTTVTVNQEQLRRRLEEAGERVVIPITARSGAAAAELMVSNLTDMAERGITLSIRSGGVSYDIPAGAIDTGALMASLGAADAEKTPLRITIKQLDSDQVTLTSGTLICPPVEFTVTAAHNDQRIEVTGFQRYVQRVFELGSDTDQVNITTAVVLENGRERHVPTEVFQQEGKWYARVHSLTNSVYALIHNEAAFTDVRGAWYEAIVTELASRQIIDGRGAGCFDGEACITRAEFAAILLRALGLPENGDANPFGDVAETAWYFGAVSKAYAYGLVNGKDAARFDPDASVTRQEAMAMIHRAAAITAFAGTSGSLDAFSDADSVSVWALADAQWALGSGLIQGKDNAMLCGQEPITRGETAAIILRLLQRSGLVDVRAEA